MDDTISRAAAIDEVSKACEELRGTFARCEERLKALPSAQPDIILCKDCKYHRYDGNIPYCANIDYGYGWEDNDFCSHAERREE